LPNPLSIIGDPFQRFRRRHSDPQTKKEVELTSLTPRVNENANADADANETLQPEAKLQKQTQESKKQEVKDTMSVFSKKHIRNQALVASVSKALDNDGLIAEKPFQIFGKPLLTAKVGRTHPNAKYVTWELPSLALSEEALKAKFEQ